MRFLLLTATLFISLAASAQMETRWRMAGTFSSAPVVVDDSTYQVSITFRSDQTANSYLPLGLQTGWRLVTGSRKMYRISAINNSTFSSANLDIVEVGTTNGAPNGLVQVYEYDGSLETIPDLPVNSTGTTAQLSAAIITHNAEVAGSGGGTVSTSPEIQGDGSPGDPLGFFGYFINHTDAANGGVPIGGTYRADVGNTMGASYGAVIIRPF